MANTPVMRDGVTDIIDAARRGADISFIKVDKDNRFAFVPDLGQGKFHDLAKYFDMPVRKNGDIHVFDAESFNRIISENMDAGNACVYVDRDPLSPAIVAVLNGHGVTGPGWGDFRVHIDFRPTPQWKTWMSIHDKFLSQVDFAEFIEENVEDILDPPGADMLEIASFLEATKETTFKSGIRLSDGSVQLQNMESVDASVGAGQKKVPEIFHLNIAPLLGSANYDVPVRFRYRVVNGKLMLGIKVQRVEDLMERVLTDVVSKIATTENITLVLGRAPSASRA